MEDKKQQIKKEELILEKLCKSIKETSQDNMKIQQLLESMKYLDGKIAKAKESISDEKQKAQQIQKLTEERQKMSKELIQEELNHGEFIEQQQKIIKKQEARLIKMKNSYDMEDQMKNEVLEEPNPNAREDLLKMIEKQEEKAAKNKSMQNQKQKRGKIVKNKSEKNKMIDEKPDEEEKTKQQKKSSESESEIKLDKKPLQSQQLLETVAESKLFQSAPISSGFESQERISPKNQNQQQMNLVFQKELNKLKEENGIIRQENEIIRQENKTIKTEIQKMDKRVKILEKYQNDAEKTIISSSLIEYFYDYLAFKYDKKSWIDLYTNKEKYETKGLTFFTIMKTKAYEYASITQEEWYLLKSLKDKRNEFAHRTLNQIQEQIDVLLNKELNSAIEIEAFRKCFEFCFGVQK